MIRRVDRHSESGVSLVLVLVTLVVFGLLVPVLGQFGTTNGVSGYIVKGQRYDRYAADNAVQSAIAYAQTRRTAGRAHVPCPNLTSTENATSTAFKRDVTVECRGFDGSGVPVGDGNTPAYAVLGLNPTDQHSVDIHGEGRITTRGAWWANGDPGRTSVNLQDVTIDATADLFGATGNCSEPAQIFAAPERCGSGIEVADPNLGSALATLDDLRADPPVKRGEECDSVDGNGVVTLPPGIHWDVDWLNELTDGSCRRDVVIWLQPGRHYFDFDFTDRSNTSARDSRWTIGDSDDHHVTVVAGTPSGWSTEVEAYAAVTQANEATGPGACDASARGAELVLGSNSNIRIESPARVEVCPLEVEGAGQRLAVTGPKSGAAGSPVAVEDAVPNSAQGNRISFPSSPPAPIGPLTERNCSRRVDCGPPGTNYNEGELRRDATITMQVPNRFTPNARLERLQLDVSHRETENREGDGGNQVGVRRVWFEVLGLEEPIECDDLPDDGDWSQRVLDCDVSGLRAPVPDVADLTVVMHIDTDSGDRGSVTVALDHVALRGEETRAVVRAQACGCDTLYFDNEGHRNVGSMFAWGTVYLPTGTVRANLGGSRAFRLARGVVADKFELEGLPGTSATPFIPVSLPGGGIYTERTVTFEALIDGNPKLRARVKFPDPVLVPDGRPEILAWNTRP